MLSRRAALALALGAAGLASACQVSPLYGERSGATALGTVRVAPVRTRVAQRVRNELISSLGRPAVADPFELSLDVRSEVSLFLTDARTDRATRGTVTVTARFTLTDEGTDGAKGLAARTLATGTERGRANFDAPTQEFARQRAIRDAQNRAARVAASRIRLAIAPVLGANGPALTTVRDLADDPERDPQ